jgi:hypothetical protein
MCFLLARDQRVYEEEAPDEGREPKDENKENATQCNICSTRSARLICARPGEQMLHCVAFSLFEDVGSRQGGS